MSIERLFNDRDGEITIVCDECGESQETGTSNFYDAIDAFKSGGGAASKVAGEWFHTCAGCSGAEVEDDFEDLA